MEMHSDILRCISDLKLLGIRIWLDDFGTGFAGLSWLRLIDFDTVKIDRSFLHDCGIPRGKAMLQDIIGLVRNRGHKILVEGVETDEQMALCVSSASIRSRAFMSAVQPPPPVSRQGRPSANAHFRSSSLHGKRGAISAPTNRRHACPKNLAPRDRSRRHRQGRHVLALSAACLIASIFAW